MTAVLTGGEPSVLRPDSFDVGAHGAAERIIDAALRCVAKWGLAKTTVDDVAREAGCARATLYRVFPGGRDALFAAVVATESGRFFGTLSAAAAEGVDLEDVLTKVVAEASRTLSEHAALQFLLAHEPEAILPHLAFRHMDNVLRVIAARGAPLLAPFLVTQPRPTGPDQGDAAIEAAARLAEWIARVVISYLTSPSPSTDLRDPASARSFVRKFVLPGVAPVAALSV